MSFWGPSRAPDLLEVGFYVGWITYVAIRGHYERGAGQSARVVDERRADLPWLVPVFVGSLALPVLYVATSLLDAFDNDVALPIRLAGVVPLVAGLRLFQRSHADLGKWWSASLELRSGQPLVTAGVYSRVRHPMYSAILLISLAQGLLLRNWLAGWMALAAFALLLTVRVPREERMLAARFGSEWQAYRLRTGRLFPRWL